jgi:hypothetical protein
MKILSKPIAIAVSLLAAVVLTPWEAAADIAADVDVDNVATLSRLTGFHPSTTTQALDAVQVGRPQNQKEQVVPSFLRDGQPRNLQEEQPSFLYVQMADKCIFQITDNGNIVLKSRHFHDQTVQFSDRPFKYESAFETESFFGNFPDLFNANNGGMPNAAITLVQDDESQDVVVSTFAKAVANGPTYIYKLEQSDEQASVKPLTDILGGDDKMIYDHCSVFIDSGGGCGLGGGCNGCYSDGVSAVICRHVSQVPLCSRS